MDQKFNILAGRKLQAHLGKTPQEVFLVPLLVGTDGRKMSKSFGNSIDVRAEPSDMYGKVMSLVDSVLIEYFKLTTDVPDDAIAEMERAMRASEANPRDLKMLLAREIVTQLYDEDIAAGAQEEFVRVFQKRDLPSDMPTFTMTDAMPIIDLMIAAHTVASRGEARRLIQQGGVRLDDEKIAQADALIPAHAAILRVGKLKFVRLVAE